MSISKMFQNPLHPYVRGLRYLKILGLPLKFDEDEKGCMVVKDSRFLKCILLTAGNEIDFTLIIATFVSDAFQVHLPFNTLCILQHCLPMGFF